MNVSLTKPELERFIQEQVTSGHFSSAADVIEAGLARLMLDPDPAELDAEDVAAIEESERNIERGQVFDWKGVSADLRRKYLGI